MIVTFCGHSQLENTQRIERWLDIQLAELISGGANTFYLGGYGMFDSMVAVAVQRAKKEHPALQSILVLPYLDKQVPSGLYDQTLYPPLENVPKRYAISHRNRWMVDNADIVVACVLHSWGGAATTLKYAERHGKRILAYRAE